MMTKYERLLEHPPVYAGGVARMLRWSENEGYPSTSTLFAHLVGVAQDDWGSTRFEGEIHRDYMSLHYLTDALKDHSNNPYQVVQYYRDVIAAEGEEEEEETPDEP